MPKRKRVLTHEQRAERHREAMRKYYRANRDKFRAYYRKNRERLITYDRELRQRDRPRHLARHKLYNDTKRNKSKAMEKAHDALLRARKLVRQQLDKHVKEPELDPNSFNTYRDYENHIRQKDFYGHILSSLNQALMTYKEIDPD